MAKKAIHKVEKLPTRNSELKIGARVRIPDLGGQIGRIIEFRGALGPNGASIYRILIRRKPKRDYIELRDDQLEPVQASK